MGEDTTAGPGDDWDYDDAVSGADDRIDPPVVVVFETKRGGDQQGVEARLTAAQRANEALKMRLSRHTYDEIAKRLGYAHRASARKAVERELAKVPRENATELLKQELETLDLLQAQIMPAILSPGRYENGKPKGPSLFALDRVLGIMDRRAKLMNLDSVPDSSGIDEFRETLKAWRASIVAEVESDDDPSDAALTVGETTEGVEHGE